MPKSAMAAARPIVERWVKRELGPEGVAKRGIDEAAQGFASLRRLPQTLAAVEAAARKVSEGPPRGERLAFQWTSFFIGSLIGAVFFLMITQGAHQAAPAREPAPHFQNNPEPPRPQAQTTTATDTAETATATETGTATSTAAPSAHVAIPPVDHAAPHPTGQR